MNAKMTKAQLEEVLKSYQNKVADKSITDRISYTLKNFKSSTRKTVLELISDIEDFLAPSEQIELPAVAYSEKPKLKGNGKSKSKTPIQDNEPKSVDGPTLNSFPVATIFPQKIVDKNIGTLVAVPEKYHTFEELKSAINDDNKTIVIGAYFPVFLIERFGYADARCEERIPKKGFAHELDLQQAIYCCDGMDRVYALSDYTEALFYYDGDMLEPIETIDTKTNNKVLTRFANGCEFEIYELVEE